jgi:glycosyltransferase involved in cell wall biosynthesis
MPLVSILIPCFNAAPWLAVTLESARAQTHRAVEIIVIDDGSTDNSVAIASGFSTDGVQVICQSNRGASAARNRGLQQARGDFIQFLDADDLLAPDKIERQLLALGSRTDLLAAGPWGRFHGSPADAVFQPEENWRDSDPVEWLTLNFAGRGMMQPGAWLTSRTLLDQAGPWDERLSLNDDGEYFCRVLLASHGIRFCPDARAYYRSNLPGSLSQRRTESAWRSALLSQELCAQHLLAREDSARTRTACADLFQRLSFAMWPDHPELVRQSEALVARHGGSRQRPGGGRLFQLLTALFGWKVARRVQTRWQRRRVRT